MKRFGEYELEDCLCGYTDHKLLHKPKEGELGFIYCRGCGEEGQVKLLPSGEYQILWNDYMHQAKLGEEVFISYYDSDKSFSKLVEDFKDIISEDDSVNFYICKNTHRNKLQMISTMLKCSQEGSLPFKSLSSLMLPITDDKVQYFKDFMEEQEK